MTDDIRYGVWGGTGGGGWCHMFPKPAGYTGYGCLQEWCGTREEAEATLRVFQEGTAKRASRQGSDPPTSYEIAVFDPDREPIPSNTHTTASPVQAQLLLSIRVLSERPKPLPRGDFLYNFNSACSHRNQEFKSETISRVITYGWAFEHPIRHELVLTRAGKEVLARAGDVTPRGEAASYLRHAASKKGV